jgi:protein TonB
VSAAATPDALTAFERMLSAHLERQKRYPRTAQIRGEEGEVQLRFVMERSGKVLEAHLERGSGHRDLDAEALALLRRAEPLPPFPPELAEGVHEWLVPIRFRLR